MGRASGTAFGISSSKAAAPTTEQQTNKTSRVKPSQGNFGRAFGAAFAFPTSQPLRTKMGRACGAAFPLPSSKTLHPTQQNTPIEGNFGRAFGAAFGFPSSKAPMPTTMQNNKTREKKLLRLAGCVANAKITNKAGETDSPDKLEQLMDSGPSSGKNFGSASGAAYAFALQNFCSDQSTHLGSDVCQLDQHQQQEVAFQ